MSINFERCGRYELREVLGEGAMGTVYRAWDPALARAVAIKVIQARALSEDLLERFRREAQVLAKLPHPHIVGVFDVSMAGDDPFIVMELVEGSSLAGLIKTRAASTTAQKLRMIIQVCDALACAHSAGVVHRDVKPGNILITAGGSAKLADFGIARLYDSTLTSTAKIVGTPAYLAPEAFSGGPIDARTDIYGVAASLYEWSCGSRPHEAGDLASLVARVTNSEAPSLAAVWTECPPRLDRCLQRGLARNPEERYQRAVDFADDLARVLEELGASPVEGAPDLTLRLDPPVAEPGTRPRKHVIAALAGTATLVALLLACPRNTASPPAFATNPESAPDTNRPPDASDTTANQPEPRTGNEPIKTSSGSDALAAGRGRPTRGGAGRFPPGRDSAASSPAPLIVEEEADEPVRRAVPIGTRVHVSLLTELRTDRSQPGHEFEGRLAEPLLFNNEVIAPAGTGLRGIVDEVRTGGSGRPPSIRLSLSELLLAGAPMKIRTARYEVVSPTDSNHDPSLTTLILGAATGALIGGVTGGSRGAATGGAIGASIAAQPSAPRPGDIVLTNPLIFRLAEPLQLAATPE
ncbi:MAG: serine/threonine-protein kinase [Acidobacteriota bacterium]|nr:serine/threonine-protein kinase [Acidobacteriota bacterium]